MPLPALALAPAFLPDALDSCTGARAARSRVSPASSALPCPAAADGLPRLRAAEREAVNFPIQGTAADILKLAMITLHNALHDRNLTTPMILQVHDELVLEAPEAEIDEVSALVKETMENAFKLSVPLRVEVGIAQTWGGAK